MHMLQGNLKGGRSAEVEDEFLALATLSHIVRAWKESVNVRPTGNCMLEKSLRQADLCCQGIVVLEMIEILPRPQAAVVCLAIVGAPYQMGRACLRQ